MLSEFLHPNSYESTYYHIGLISKNPQAKGEEAIRADFAMLIEDMQELRLREILHVEECLLEIAQVKGKVIIEFSLHTCTCMTACQPPL